MSPLHTRTDARADVRSTYRRALPPSRSDGPAAAPSSSRSRRTCFGTSVPTTSPGSTSSRGRTEDAAAPSSCPGSPPEIRSVGSTRDARVPPPPGARGVGGGSILLPGSPHILPERGSETGPLRRPFGATSSRCRIKERRCASSSRAPSFSFRDDAKVRAPRIFENPCNFLRRKLARPSSRVSETTSRGVSERHVLRLLGQDDEPGHDLLRPRLLERDIELVTLDPLDRAVAELLVEDPVAAGEG